MSPEQLVTRVAGDFPSAVTALTTNSQSHSVSAFQHFDDFLQELALHRQALQGLLLPKEPARGRMTNLERMPLMGQGQVCPVT